MKKIHFKSVPVYIERYVRWRAWDHYTCKISFTTRLKNIGLDSSTVSRIMKMKLLPTLHTAMQLDVLTNGALKYADTMLEVQSIRDYSKIKNSEMSKLKNKFRYKKARANRLIQYKDLAKKLKKETAIEIPEHIKKWKHKKNINDIN